MDIGPGDVISVLGSNGIFSHLIRFAERVAGKPDLTEHVCIITHQDERGRWMGISGQPGGVAVCDVTRYLDSPIARSNHAQPRPDDRNQVAAFLTSCAKSLGVAYDWVAVTVDTLDAFHMHDLSKEIEHIWAWPTPDNVLPAHVVCSSLAARLYETVGWAHPDLGDERVCLPADWWAWSDNQAWLNQEGATT